MATWPRRKENNDRIFNNGVSIIFIPFSQLMNAWVELKLPDAAGLQRLNNQSVVSVGREWGRRQRNGNFHQLPTIKSAPLEGLCKLSHRRNERAGSDQQDTPTYLSGYEAVSWCEAQKDKRNYWAGYHRETDGFMHGVCLAKKPETFIKHLWKMWVWIKRKRGFQLIYAMACRVGKIKWSDRYQVWNAGPAES